MRYLIKYTKESEIKFIAHLDLMRTIQRTIRRSGLPAEYSKGFNPHLNLSIAQPLSVGVYSDGEYADLFLTEEVNEDEIVRRLNEKSARGIKFLACTRIPDPQPNEKKTPPAMALIDACRYTIKIKYLDTSELEERMNFLLNQEEWKTIKKSKKCEKEINIKDYIYEFKFWIKDDYLVINTLIQSGSREHLSADLLVSYIKENTNNVDEDAFVDVKREEMYFLREDKYEPLCNCR